jgi:hypothetical protein
MSEYQKLNSGIKDLVSEVKEFQQQLRTLKDLAALIGGPKDTPLLRAKLTKEREETLDLSKKILFNLADKPINQTERMQHEKISKEFEGLFTHYNKINQQIMHKERGMLYDDTKEDKKSPNSELVTIKKSSDKLEQPPPEELKSPSSSTTSGSSELTEKQRNNPLLKQKTDKKETAPHGNLGELEEIIYRDRNEELKSLERDMVEVNAMFKDISALVEEQAYSLNSVDKQVELTDLEAHRAQGNLISASKYQANARKKLYLLAIVAFLAVLVMGIILGLSL